MASATAPSLYTQLVTRAQARRSRSHRPRGLPYALTARQRSETYVDRPFSPPTPPDQVMENRVVAALRILGPSAKIQTLTRLLSLEPDQVETTLERLVRVGRVQSLGGPNYRLRTADDAR